MNKKSKPQAGHACMVYSRSLRNANFGSSLQIYDTILTWQTLCQKLFIPISYVGISLKVSIPSMVCSLYVREINALEWLSLITVL